MTTKEYSDWKGCWAILWRSILFIPYMLAVFVGVGGVWLSRWLLPVCGATFFYLQQWWAAGVAFALWSLAVWAYRRFRLSRFFEAPPSLL